MGAVSTAAFRGPGDAMARWTARMARTKKAVVSGVPGLVARGPQPCPSDLTGFVAEVRVCSKP